MLSSPGFPNWLESETPEKRLHELVVEVSHCVNILSCPKQNWEEKFHLGVEPAYWSIVSSTPLGEWVVSVDIGAEEKVGE